MCERNQILLFTPILLIIVDYSAAYQVVIMIKDCRLPGCYRVDRLVEGYPESAAGWLNGGHSTFASVPDAHQCSQRGVYLAYFHQIAVRYINGAAEQIVFGAKRDGIVFRIDVCDIHWLAECYLQAFALPNGVVGIAFVPPQNTPVGADEISVRDVQIFR